MLVLTRRLNETIVIDNNIRVTVVSIGPGRVKIGIDAPANVRIDREEIHERIVEENTTSTEPAAPSRTDEPLLVGDDTPKIHNRIADKLPADDAVPTAMTTDRLERFRRKPR